MSTQRTRGIRIIAALYLLSALSMATVGVIVPSRLAFADALGTTPAGVGVAISLFSMAPALLATIGGSAIDRIGLKRAMVCAAVIAMTGDLVAFVAPSIWVFGAGLLLAGLGYAGIAVSAPAMLIATLEGEIRIRGMSFWSTYAPVGFACGLLIAALFADGGLWRMGLVLHMLLLGVAGAAAAAVLPSPDARRQDANSRGEGFAEMLAVLRKGPVIRLGIAVALPNAISYGTSLVAPSYLAAAHNVSVAASSTTVAIAKIVAVLVGGIVTGHLLSRRANGATVFTIVALLGAVAQGLLYLPGGSFVVATAALMLWLFAFGGMAGTAMAMLPGVVGGSGREGAASGVVNQCISLASLAAPSIWFGVSGWTGFVGLAWTGILISLLVLPGRRPAPPPRPSVGIRQH